MRCFGCELYVLIKLQSYNRLCDMIKARCGSKLLAESRVRTRNFTAKIALTHGMESTYLLPLFFWCLVFKCAE